MVRGLTLVNVLFTMLAPSALTTTTYVPDDYRTIQEAINVADVGDVVVVRPGTYVESIHLNISITVKCEKGAVATAIDGYSAGNVVYINGSWAAPTVEGFTICSVSTSGVTCYYASTPTVRNNIILATTAVSDASGRSRS